MPEWDPREDGWFAGFADGEGCFVIVRRTDRGVGFSVRFQLGLRADDLAILERLRDAFGGTLRVYPHPNGRPQCMWVVCAKRDLAALAKYFDRFPLRAKKARDCAIWRRAVAIVCSKGSGSDELGLLVDALRSTRAFDGEPVDPLVAAEAPQLRLVERTVGIGAPHGARSV